MRATMRQVLRHRVTWLAVAALLVSAMARGGLAQDQPTQPRSEADVHRIRGTLAWRRAVWRVERSAFSRVVTELERSRRASQGPTDFTTLYLLGFAYTRLGRTDEAAPVLADARALLPGFPGFFVIEALQLTREGKHEDALARMEEYVKALAEYGPDRPLAAELEFLGYLVRGTTQVRRNKYEPAKRDLQRALAICTANDRLPAPELVAVLAQVHQWLDEHAGADELIRTVLHRDPGEPSHYYNLAQIHVSQQRTSDARRWFEAALLRRPDFAEAHAKLAYLDDTARQAVAMGRHLEAYAWIAEATARGGSEPVEETTQADIAAGFGMWWKAVGTHREEQGDEPGALLAYENAKREFLEALSRKPNCFQAISFMIQLLSRTGEPDEVIDRYKEELRQYERVPATKEPFRATFC